MSVDRRLIALMAVAGGASVANLYYIQPLLPTVAARFAVSEAAAGGLVTASQVGYAAGLVLLVPLGDIADRRRLCVVLLALCGAALWGVALAPSLVVLAIALTLAAMASAVAQVLVPFAGNLADDRDRGRAVGIVLTGLFMGILLARTVSGLLASVAGWRSPFLLAAVLAWVLAVVLGRRLPSRPPSSSLTYGAVLASTARMVVVVPLLRRRMLYGACGFAGFSVLWTALAFLLAGDPYHYGTRTISVFGLAGLAGAVGARRIGMLADRGLVRPATGVLLTLTAGGWIALALGASSLVALVIAIVLVDFAVQGQNVLSQSVLARHAPSTAGRTATAYVTSNFAGGAIGSAGSVAAWSAGGWSGVCWLGGAICALSLALWLGEGAQPKDDARRVGR